MANQREYFLSSFVIPPFSVGLGQRELDLFQLLNDPANGVSVVGLVGMSGIGKTALASLFFQSRRRFYDKASFLENVRARHAVDMQRQLLFDLCGTVDWDKSKYGTRIRNCITAMRVLIVVDDVGSLDDLAALQISAFREGKAVRRRSKAVITGQDWTVMEDYVVRRVHVAGLEDLDAMALFSHHAFQGAKDDHQRYQLIHELMLQNDPSHSGSNLPGPSHGNVDHHSDVVPEFESVAAEIVHACGGNPLSLHMVGEFLGKQKRVFGAADLLEVYKEALCKLRHAQILGGGKSNDQLWTRFWARYHDLDRPEQEMFVEFACLGANESATTNRLTVSPTVSRETFISHSKSGSPRISLQNLIDKSFIVVIQPGGQLSMHNHHRDMGRRNRPREGVQHHQCHRYQRRLERCIRYIDGIHEIGAQGTGARVLSRPAETSHSPGCPAEPQIYICPRFYSFEVWWATQK